MAQTRAERAERQRAYYHSRGGRTPTERVRDNERSRAAVCRRRARVNDMKLAAGCMDCGFRDHPEALQFDHRPGEMKLFNVGEGVSNRGWAQIEAEIEKCDVVCANCHAVRTARRRKSSCNS